MAYRNLIYGEELSGCATLLWRLFVTVVLDPAQRTITVARRSTFYFGGRLVTTNVCHTLLFRSLGIELAPLTVVFNGNHSFDPKALSRPSATMRPSAMAWL